MSNSGGPLPPCTVTMRAPLVLISVRVKFWSIVFLLSVVIARSPEKGAREQSRNLFGKLDCFASLAMTWWYSLAPRLVEPQFAPARFGCVDVLRRRPDQRRKPRAVEFGIG